MADKGWTAQVATAAGVAAAIGAAQLGLGYGLAVVVWTAADDSTWLGSLGWATWIAASSTVFGAVIASRLTRSPGPATTDAAASRTPMRIRTATVAANAQRPPNALELSSPAKPSDTTRPADSPRPARPSRRAGGPWRLTLATSAAIGALLTVALVAVPAHFSVRPDTFTPATVAGGYTLLGVLIGLVIAYWAVVSRPVAANLCATAAWLWILAIAAVIVDLTQHRASATYLTSWQFADPHATQHGIVSWPSSLLTLLSALLLGLLSVWPSVRRGNFTIGASASGAVGPLLVAAAFFVLAPQLTTALGALESAYLIAPYAVLAGLGGSALTVAIGRRAAERRSDPGRSDRSARATQRTRKARSARTAQPAGKPEPSRTAQRAGKSQPSRTDQPAGKPQPSQTDQPTGKPQSIFDELPPGEDRPTGQGRPASTVPQPVPAPKPQRGTARAAASITSTPRSTPEAIPPKTQSKAAPADARTPAVPRGVQSKGVATTIPAAGEGLSSTDPDTSDKSGFWTRFRRKGNAPEAVQPTAPEQPRSRKSGSGTTGSGTSPSAEDPPSKAQPAGPEPAKTQPAKSQPPKAQSTKSKPSTAQPQRNTVTPAQPPPSTPVPIQPPPSAPAPLKPGPSAPNPVSAPRPTAPEPKSTVARPPASPPVAQIAPPPASKPAKSARPTRPKPKTGEETS